jgi:hypothetical protein
MSSAWTSNPVEVFHLLPMQMQLHVGVAAPGAMATTRRAVVAVVAALDVAPLLLARVAVSTPVTPIDAALALHQLQLGPPHVHGAKSASRLAIPPMCVGPQQPHGCYVFFLGRYRP